MTDSLTFTPPADTVGRKEARTRDDATRRGPVSSPLLIAVDEAIKWGVSGTLTAVAGAALLWRTRIGNWFRTMQASRQSKQAMYLSWPTIVEEIKAGRRTEQFEALSNDLLQIKDGMNDLLAMNYGQFDLSDTPAFVCDHMGKIRLVNTAYCKLLHTGRQELMDYGYRQYMTEDSQDEFVTRFRIATDEHRELDMEVTFHAGGGAFERGRLRMVPHPRLIGPATHWIGAVTPAGPQ